MDCHLDIYIDITVRIEGVWMKYTRYCQKFAQIYYDQDLIIINFILIINLFKYLLIVNN